MPHYAIRKSIIEPLWAASRNTKEIKRGRQVRRWTYCTPGPGNLEGGSLHFQAAWAY